MTIDQLVQTVHRALDGCASPLVDCAALERAVDERWGAAPDVDTRLAHFDSLWAHIGSTYVGFATYRPVGTTAPPPLQTTGC